jgi:hypothetical protein
MIVNGTKDPVRLLKTPSQPGRVIDVKGAAIVRTSEFRPHGCFFFKMGVIFGPDECLTLLVTE